MLKDIIGVTKSDLEKIDKKLAEMEANHEVAILPKEDILILRFLLKNTIDKI